MDIKISHINNVESTCIIYNVDSSYKNIPLTDLFNINIEFIKHEIFLYYAIKGLNTVKTFSHDEVNLRFINIISLKKLVTLNMKFMRVANSHCVHSPDKAQKSAFVVECPVNVPSHTLIVLITKL
jgi:hypothetical protein